MQQIEKTTQATPCPVQQTIDSLLTIGEGKENLHSLLDDFYLAWLHDSLDYAPDRDAMTDHFYLFSHMQKLLRVAEESPSKTVKP